VVYFAGISPNMDEEHYRLFLSEVPPMLKQNLTIPVFCLGEEKGLMDYLESHCNR